jgi:hypothetical protein
MLLKINKNRPVALPFPPRPVINPNNSNFVTDSCGGPRSFDCAKEHIGAALESEMLSEPEASLTAKSIADQPHRFGETFCLTAIALSHMRQALGENLAAAVFLNTKEST